MRASVSHVVFLDAVYEHGHRAFAVLLRDHPESAVQRAFENGRQFGWIECDGKLSRATLTEQQRAAMDLSRALRGLRTP